MSVLSVKDECRTTLCMFKRHKSSTLLPPLPSSLFRRCSETTTYLRKITIPLSDPSKFCESAKSAGEDVRVEEPPDEVPIPDPPQAMWGNHYPHTANTIPLGDSSESP
ncbi:hypothetical protein DPMN_052749 [Dreissena polymorpha]|uniref:Uncharacterized protein n=1 Tax=Dreissena polymorpha TaxID=45954 RepID=A0A9D4CK86_DREPO|nr:hypothetical protein DPMN_052749 [Dreissena polymorpha]